MSYHTKILFLGLGLCIVTQTAQSASLCKPDMVGLVLIAGKYNPPAFIPPDAEQLKETGKAPYNIITEGWHNLRAAERPLTLVCRYKGRPEEAFNLPDDTNSCELTNQGRFIFECRR